MSSESSAVAAPAEPARSADARTYKRRPIIAVVNLLAAATTLAIVIVRGGFDVDNVVGAIGVLTPVAMIYFMLAFICRPLDDLLHNSVTGWLLANRRYLGLSFAAWYLMHWPILLTALALLGPAEFWEWFGDFAIPAGTILTVITLMAATSTDRAQRFLGMRLWSAFHTVGLYLAWAWSFRIYLQRIPEFADRHDYVYLWLLVGVLAFRWIMAVRRLFKRRA